MSRRTKLNPSTQESIIKSLKAGNSRRDSALFAGVSEQTFYTWLKKGRNGKAPYVEFLEAVEKAEATACVRNVAIIQKAAADTWQAAAWWLERKRPDEWGRRQRFDLATNQDQPMKITVQIGGKAPGEE